MIDSIDDAIDVIRGPLHTVVHVGAGAGGQLALYRRLGAERVALIEPNPAFDPAPLEADDDLDVERISIAVAPSTATHTLLKVANYPSFSSLLPYRRLKEFFPNIDVRDEVEVEAVTLHDLLDQLQLSTGTHALVLELQGLEADVLAETSPEQLISFDWIVVRTSEEELYEQSDVRGELLVDRLERLGFVALCLSEAAPPFVVYVGVRNPMGATLEVELAAVSAAAQKESSALARRIEQLIAVNARLKDDSTLTIDRLRVELAGVRESADSKAREAGELQTRLDELESSQQALVEESTGTIDQLNVELAGVKEALKAAEARSRKLELSLDESQSARVEHSASLQVIRMELADAKDRSARLEAELNGLATKASEAAAENSIERDERLAEVKVLTQTNQSLADEVRQRQKEIDELQSQVASKDDEVSNLEHQIREMEFRQQILDREVLRAEAQIEFIGDVLIRERQL
jgi:FkbM family methyltransferase